MTAVAILSYHKIGEPPASGWDTWYYVSRARFREQLLTLQRLGWKAIDAEASLAALDDPEQLRQPSALITFDDGYRSLVREAVPVLEELGFPGVVFVPTSYVGATNSFDA